jgi:hypothetical protein
MKIKYRFETKLFILLADRSHRSVFEETSIQKFLRREITVFVKAPWMGFLLGEGELEIDNQGRSLFSSKVFTQEANARSQQTPRIGEWQAPKESSVQDARANSSSTPHFFFSTGCA